VFDLASLAMLAGQALAYDLVYVLAGVDGRADLSGLKPPD
jgi:hypothetical protein